VPTVIPPDPSLQHLRKQAKDLLKSYRRGDQEAQDRIQLGPPDDASRPLTLRDAQHIIAHEHCFESRSRLKEYVEWDLPVRAQNVQSMQSLLEEDPGRARQMIRQYRPNGTYWEKAAIHFANNDIAMAKLLQEYRAETDPPGDSILVPKNTPGFIDYAISIGVNLENPYYNGTVLSIASYWGSAETVGHLIKRGANVNTRCETEDLNTWETPLHRAAFSAQPDDPDRPYAEVVRLLIEGGARVDAQTNVGVSSDMAGQLICRGEIPLHFAASRGSIATIQHLLEGKSARDIQTDEGKTSLDYAVEAGRSQAILDLLK
jgi:hypothetical protein